MDLAELRRMPSRAQQSSSPWFPGACTTLRDLGTQLFTQFHETHHRLDTLGRRHTSRLLELRRIDTSWKLVEDAVLPRLIDGEPHESQDYAVRVPLETPRSRHAASDELR